MLAQLLAGSPPSAAVLLVFTAAWLAATACWLWTLYDCLVAGRVAGREKIVWTAVLLGTYVLGAAAYLFAVRMRKPLPPTG